MQELYQESEECIHYNYITIYTISIYTISTVFIYILMYVFLYYICMYCLMFKSESTLSFTLNIMTVSKFA